MCPAVDLELLYEKQQQNAVGEDVLSAGAAIPFAVTAVEKGDWVMSCTCATLSSKLSGS